MTHGYAFTKWDNGKWTRRCYCGWETKPNEDLRIVVKQLAKHIKSEPKKGKKS